MGRIVEQLREHKAYALVVAQEWPTQPWRNTLVGISQTMWLFPESETGCRLYQDADGHHLQQRNWRTVACLVDLRGQSQTESTQIRHVISKILGWQEGERPKTDWDAIKEIESTVQRDENEQRDQPSHNTGEEIHTSHGIRQLTDYQEVKKSVALQAKVCREKLEAEFKNTVL